MQKISYQDLQSTCQALHAFAKARSQKKPDKDVILAVKKIDGRETLKAIRISKMKWYSRIIKWFGLGNATLKSVASFLHDNEPHIPRKFSDLKNRDTLANNFTDEAIEQLSDITKENHRKLKRQKAKGCEIFKHCLSHHNKHLLSKKIYLSLNEDEKIDLYYKSFVRSMGIQDSGLANPMSSLSDKNWYLRYQNPIIDRSEFGYLDPSFNKEKGNLDDHILGFCYEYGLGTKKNEEKALENYHHGVEANEYSACYNLGCLYFKKDNFDQAIFYLKQGEDILLKKLEKAHKYLDVSVDIIVEILDIQYVESKEEFDYRTRKIKEFQEPFLKMYNKALYKTYLALIETYKKIGDETLSTEYQQKAEEIKQQRA